MIPVGGEESSGSPAVRVARSVVVVLVGVACVLVTGFVLAVDSWSTGTDTSRSSAAPVLVATAALVSLATVAGVRRSRDAGARAVAGAAALVVVLTAAGIALAAWSGGG